MHSTSTLHPSSVDRLNFFAAAAASKQQGTKGTHIHTYILFSSETLARLFKSMVSTFLVYRVARARSVCPEHNPLHEGSHLVNEFLDSD